MQYHNDLHSKGMDPTYFAEGSLGLDVFLSSQLARVNAALNPTITLGYINGGGRTAFALFLSLSLALVLTAALLVWIWRRTRVMYASSPMFCWLFLCGLLFNLLSVAMLLESPTPAICAARKYLLNLGFMLSLSSLFAKTWVCHVMSCFIFTALCLKMLTPTSHPHFCCLSPRRCCGLCSDYTKCLIIHCYALSKSPISSC